MSTMASTCSIIIGHSSTQARQVVHDHSVSASTRPLTIGWCGWPPCSPIGLPGYGLPANCASVPPAVPMTMSSISFFGFSGWPAAKAGHMASHLPHCTQASKPSSWFREVHRLFHAQRRIRVFQSSGLRPVERPPPKRSARRCGQCRAPAKACFIGPPQVMPKNSSDTPHSTPSRECRPSPSHRYWPAGCRRPARWRRRS